MKIKENIQKQGGRQFSAMLMTQWNFQRLTLLNKNIKENQWMI